MTKKDYVKFARMLREIREGIDPVLVEYTHGKEAAMLKAICERFADTLAEDNERFDRDRFFQAIYGEEKGKGE